MGPRPLLVEEQHSTVRTEARTGELRRVRARRAGDVEDRAARGEAADELHRVAILADHETATRADADVVGTVHHVLRRRLEDQRQLAGVGAGWPILPDLARPRVATLRSVEVDRAVGVEAALETLEDRGAEGLA